MEARLRDAAAEPEEEVTSATNTSHSLLSEQRRFSTTWYGTVRYTTGVCVKVPGRVGGAYQVVTSFPVVNTKTTAGSDLFQCLILIFRLVTDYQT